MFASKRIKEHAIAGIICLAILSISHGQLHEENSKAIAPVYFVQYKSEFHPVVGVQSRTKVQILLPSKERKAVSYPKIKWVMEHLRLAGRITVSESSLIVYRGSSVKLKCRLTADRDIEECYAALHFHMMGVGEMVAFEELGNLVAGEPAEFDIRFSISNNYSPVEKFQLKFFENGFPIESYNLTAVYDQPGTRFLGIPWEERLTCFLNITRQNKATSRPIFFEREFEKFDDTGIRNRGIERIYVTLKITEEGHVHLERIDNKLTQEELTSIAHDMESWRCFPATRNGIPYSSKVKIPLTFSSH